MSKHLPVITINREYGAGGRSLAAILSEKLGIPYYDKDFVLKTMEESGYDREDVEREGEELSRSSMVLNDILNGTVSYTSSHDAIFNAERNVILKLAETPCIIVGRCANIILAEAGIDSINVYLHGPMENKLKHMDEISTDGKPVTEKSMEEHERKRRTFFKKYTGYEIFDASNYTFCFDVGKVDIPKCAEIVLGMLNRS
ncbi:MAG: cytidylate kinase-like family protein [Butyrivibrio sp.]|nr:cytidylate kinase-like family protein [Butyrivibrio sp.]